MGVSYFNGPVDPEDFEDGHADKSARKSRLKLNLAIFGVVLLALSSTYAANISLGGSRKEFGQGIYQIKACDQWVGLGLQTGAGIYSTKVQTIALYGFDPRLCVGRIFRIKVFQTGSSTPLDLFLGPGASSGTDTASVLSLMDTSTPFSSSGYTSSGGNTAYENWSWDAVTIVDKYGRNIGYQDTYTDIAYYPSTGVYKIQLTYPLATAAAVTSVTIESAKYN